jgi:predicted anti-sigma-YlaC factor YlaD
MECAEAIDVMGEALDGCLEVSLQRQFDEHLVECHPCRTYFEQLTVTRAALRAVASEGGTSPRRDELIAGFRTAMGRGRSSGSD